MQTSEHTYNAAVFQTLDDAKRGINTSKRFRGLKVFIISEQQFYWFRDGISNSDLILYQPNVALYSVASIQDRDDIPMGLRFVGMEVVVVLNGRVARYQLANGLTNDCWTEVVSNIVLPENQVIPINPQYPLPTPPSDRPVPPSDQDDSNNIFKTNITGDGITKEFNITHNLNSEFVRVLFYDVLKQMVYVCFTKDSNNAITVHFDYPLDSGDMLDVICRKD